jgi:sulfite reductase alpha subunit-like flavoprotein
MPPTFELRFLDEDHHGESNGSGSGTLQNNGDGIRATNGIGHHDASTASSSSNTSDTDIRWMSTVKNERITSPDHWQDVRRLEFRLPDSAEADLEYEAGDIATLRPANDAGMVDALITRMGWMSHRDRPVGLFDRQGRRIQLPPLSKPLTDASAVEETMTLHSYLVNHTSPFSPLRPSLFPLLRPFSPKGHLEREKLDEFCTPGDGYEDAMEYGVRTRRTIAEVLDEFQTVQFEPRWAAEVFGGGNEEGEGGMREREFSIACGPSVSVKVEHKHSVQSLTPDHESLLPNRNHLAP